VDSSGSNLELRGSSLVNVDETTQWLFDVGEIELGSQLGAGTYGTVYKGSLRGKSVAVKKLNTQDLAQDKVRHGDTIHSHLALCDSPTHHAH
jgi:serine/threonine protein kinase